MEGITGGPKKPVSQRMTRAITIRVNNIRVLLSAQAFTHPCHESKKKASVILLTSEFAGRYFRLI
jgi:hypothetical protein